MASCRLTWDTKFIGKPHEDRFFTLLNQCVKTGSWRGVRSTCNHPEVSAERNQFGKQLFLAAEREGAA